MARIRTIKPEFPQSESVGNLSRDARLCFIMLWTIADDSGRLRGASRMLASLLFPYDTDAARLMDKWLEELSAQHCITRYEVDGAQYIQITNWLEHQKIDRPSQSKFPEFDASSRTIAKPREDSSQDLRTKDQGPKEGIKDARGAFDRFWKAYPKKEAKGDAEKAFAQSCKQADPEIIIAKCAGYRWSDEKRFIPLPASWLRDRRWEDEQQPAEQPKPRAGSGTQYEAPAHNPDVAWKIKAENYAKNLAMNIPLGMSASDQDIRRMVKEGIITKELAEQRGYNLWRAA